MNHKLEKRISLLYDNSMKDNFDILLKAALSEDLEERGDVTSRAIFSTQKGNAKLVSKDEGILAGLGEFQKVFNHVDSSIEISCEKKDGDKLSKGDIIARLSGPVVSILEAERTGINFISFLSGIASDTAKVVEAANGHCIILDTRKTLPGWRRLSKYAVKVGGGENHRMGLFDMVMIKDNHADAAGSITNAVNAVRNKWGDEFKIEVECRNIEGVKEALSLNVDVIMLDNMDTDTVKKCVALRSGNTPKFESSGNMTIEKVREYAPTGIDYISLGALTHSVKAFDFSLVMEDE